MFEASDAIPSFSPVLRRKMREIQARRAEIQRYQRMHLNMLRREKRDKVVGFQGLVKMVENVLYVRFDHFLINLSDQ